MPLVPVDQPVIDVALVNVPVDATPSVQRLIQSGAEMSVARHVIELRFEQLANIC